MATILKKGFFESYLHSRSLKEVLYLCSIVERRRVEGSDSGQVC